MGVHSFFTKIDFLTNFEQIFSLWSKNLYSCVFGAQVHFCIWKVPEHSCKSPWDRSIISILKPSFDMALFQYFWRFTQEICSIWTQNCFWYCFWTILRVQLPETITKTILRPYAANFLQICVNFQKYWNNAMSNDGLI